MLGFQVGANWQDQLVVWGIQADGSWTDFDGNDGGAFGAIDSVETNYLLAATGNVGIAIEHYKPYVLGGLAVMDYDYDLSNLAGTAVESHGSTEVGGVLGAGLEVAVAPNVSIFGEYRHYWFDGDGHAFAGPGAVPAQTITPEFGIDTVNAGINWRF